MVQQGLPGDDPLLVLQQVAQQIELPAGELHPLAVHAHLVPVGVHGEGTGGEQAPGRLRGLGGALAQGRPDAGQQLLDGKGLGNVVVRPHVQAGHLIHHRVPGGEHDDGHLAFPPQPPQHLHAAEGGEHDVQQDELMLPGQGPVQPGAAVEGLLHLVALVAELQLYHAGQLLLVLDQQNFFRHVRTLPGRMSGQLISCPFGGACSTPVGRCRSRQ